jgi:hypothetical protein
MNIALLAAFILLLLLFVYVVYCSIVGQRPLAPWQPLKRRQVAVSPAHPTPEALIKIEISEFYSLQWQLGELANRAWTTAQSFQLEPFELSLRDFAELTAPAQVVESLLHHARRIAPGFEVPYMVPRILVESLPFAAGQFEVDGEGWVTLKVGLQFFEDQLAAQAILAHEVCHYILENSGIRKSDRELNERHTDLCMFVCGFGSIFLAGYKREMAQYESPPGHRLGYLTYR